MCRPVHEVFGSEASLRQVHYRSGSERTISRFLSSEEYSHVISSKEPFWSDVSNAAGNDCCPVYVCHLRRSPGPACSQVGAFRRILLLSFRRRCARPTSRSIGPIKQSPGSEPPRCWP